MNAPAAAAERPGGRRSPGQVAAGDEVPIAAFLAAFIAEAAAF